MNFGRTARVCDVDADDRKMPANLSTKPALWVKIEKQVFYFIWTTSFVMLKCIVSSQESWSKSCQCR